MLGVMLTPHVRHLRALWRGGGRAPLHCHSAAPSPSASVPDVVVAWQSKARGQSGRGWPVAAPASSPPPCTRHLSAAALQLADLKRRVEESRSVVNVRQVESEIATLEPQVSAPGFWDDQAAAQRVLAELAASKETLGRVSQWDSWLADANAALELAEEVCMMAAGCV